MLDSGFSAEDINLLLSNIDQLDEEELTELEGIVSDLAERQRVQTLRDDLIAFCCHIQGDYKVGAHHKRLAALLEDIEARRKDRICVSVPPRHGKSQLVSIYYAAWYMGRNPSHKVMLVSHTTDLAVDFGRKIRNLISTTAYQEVFPGVQLASDSKSAGRWNTNQGGEFFAAGVGSALAGRGAHLLLVDDPHSEQDILNGNYGVFDKAYEWFTFGARTRLMPYGAVAIVHTRWAPQDLIGRVVGDMAKNEGADQYEVFEFPALLDANDPDTGEPIQKALWPEFFDVPALLRTKAINADHHLVDTGLRRVLGPADLTLLGIGAIIGAGIFVLTGVAAATKAGPAIVLSYGIAGLACAFSALAYAELAAAVGGCGSVPAGRLFSFSSTRERDQ